MGSPSCYCLGCLSERRERVYEARERESRERVGWPGAGNEIREDRDVSGSAVPVLSIFGRISGSLRGGR